MGREGKAGELWYVRLLPPLVPQLATYHVGFTTPYVLIDAMKKDWIDFLRRNTVGMKATGEAEALHRLLADFDFSELVKSVTLKNFHFSQRRAVFEMRWKDFEHELELRVHMGPAEVDEESPSL